LPTTDNRRFAAARTNVRRVLDDVISAYRADGADHGDLLSVLLTASDLNTGDVMTQTQVRDEIMGILLTGSQAVSIVPSGLLYELRANPIIEERLRAHRGLLRTHGIACLAGC
jgi:cytochrome P450